MNKNTFLVALVCLAVGFGIGFYWTNSMNRSAVKEAEEKLRQAQLGGGGPSGNPTGQAPNDNIHQGMPTPQEIEQAIKIAPEHRDDFEAQTKIGGFLYHLAKRYKEARECLETAHKLKPDDYQTIVELGNLNFDDGKFEVAADWYEKAAKINPKDVNVRTDLGNTFFQRQPPQYAKAVEHYRESLKADPSHVQTLHNMAFALIALNNRDEAKTVVEKLAQVDPNNQSLPELRSAVDQIGAKRDIPTH